MANRWLTRMFDGAVSRALELRTSLENPQTPLSYPAEWLLDIFNGGRTDSGIRVSEMTALQVGTVFAAVNLISDGVSSLPVHVYQKTKIAGRASKSIADDSSLYGIIHQNPNPEMTNAVFMKTLIVHDLLWGNAYAEIERNASAQIIALWPRNPARTRPIRLLKALTLEGDLLPPGTMLYETSDSLEDCSSAVIDENPDKSTMTNSGLRRLVLAENMIHVPGLSLDGRLGQSTVWLARQAFGLALATEKYGAKFFGNGARPAGILTLPNKLEDKAIDTLRRSWAEAHGGENQFRIAVLEQGVKYEKIAATPEEGQMLETRRYEREEICAIFGVPAHMVCAQEKGGKSNVEQSSIEFVLYCLHPWLNRYEQEFGRKLFPTMGRSAGKYFVKFDTRKLMYPDAAARSTFYSQGKQWGFLNTNMILELEDMNPVEDKKVGETFWQPINMQDAGDPQKLGAEDQAAIDTKKATDVAEHAAQMAQETAAAATKNQMKTAEQTHGHAMEAAKVGNVHAQKMAKLTPQSVAAAAPAAGAPGAAPAAAAPPAKQIKRFLNPTEVRSAMAEALSEGFFFISAATVGSEISYRYARPDHAELFIVHAPCKTLEQCFIEGIAPEERGSKARAMTKDYSKTLLVMRHGQTALDPVKISDGWLDFPLSDEGRVRLITAQQYLKNIPLKNIYASSLKRTAETAAIVESGNVSNQRPVIHIVDAARTWNLGELSGTSKKESRPIVEDFMKNPDKVPVGGESRNDFLERFLPWLESMKAEVSAGGGPTLLVMSGSNLRELSTSMTGDMETWDLSEGGLLVLTFANGVWLGNVVFGLREADDDTQRIS